MDNIFIIAGVISIIFLITKFIEMRFIEKENKPKIPTNPKLEQI